ncbi:MAG: hypothetical protein RJQ08_03850 [Salinisphaeraceae bacterium]
MAHANVYQVLASAVATSGTFTVGYPSGTSKGDFLYGSDHRMVALQREMKVGKEFTIAFGDASATITYLGATTLAAGSSVRVQLDKGGTDRLALLPNSTRLANVVLVNLGSPDTADADGILDGFAVGATADTFTSSDFVTAFSGTLDVPRALTMTGSAGSDHVITVNGFDQYGVAMSETFTLSGTNVIAGKKAFYQITGGSVAAGGAAGDTVDVGWGDVLGLPFFLKDIDMILAEYEADVKVSGGAQKVFLPWQYGATQINAGTSWELVSPVYGDIVGIRSTIQIAFTTGGDVTVEVNTTAVDGLSMAVGTDAAGVRDSDTPTAGHATRAIAPGDRIEVIGSSGFDSAGALNGVLEIIQHAAQNGTYVVGSQAEATATSGDVRGTFDPLTACDGIVGFAVLVALDDIGYRGAPQYAA